MTIEQIFVYGGIFTLVVLLQSAGLFLLMQFKKDNSLIDIAYGPLFFTSACITLFLSKSDSVLSLIIIPIIAIWALRLAYRIGKKNWGRPEDVRYAAWRTEWMKKGNWYFLLRSFLQINFLQGLLIVLIAFPFVISLTANQFSWLFAFIGAAVSLTGIALETTADKQIDNFISGKKTGTITEPFLAGGLFRYSRRPNYFGETLVWWGLSITVLPLPFGYLGLIGPITITYIVTVVTGPMLEKIFIEKYGAIYQDYMKITSYFIPLPPRRER